MFFNLFSRKKKIADVKAAPIAAPAIPPVIAPVVPAVEQASPDEPQPDEQGSPDEQQPVEQPSRVEQQPVDAPAADVAAVVRAARATSPRTGTAKVAPPKASPTTRPGSKPAAKPQASGAGRSTPSANVPTKPSRQALLDAVRAVPAEPAQPDAEHVSVAGTTAAGPTPEQPTPAPPTPARVTAAMTVPQLRLRARELGLIGYSRLAKADLLRAIVERLAANESPADPDDELGH
ncbi:Rho termination factor-like protein [Glaciihabitans tibetensis]|uniref:Rho termination factor-like protein n=1 Tax=Glaciihabitans tibetensis TaxID=1266600 RepID=A0A2T0VHH2_9MICO|nr:Rho termination factor N-terminal domain-containing protein [Glaciihabitans tibetensis]PRY69664.1 Rho termination factor-like protein [Glaciihabitans tibetensis]